MSLQPCESENAFASEVLNGTALVSEMESSTITAVNSIANVPAGTYLVIGKLRYANGTGIRDMGITTTSASGTMEGTQGATPSGETTMSAAKIITLSQTGTIYLNGFQTSGSKISLPASYLTAYRLF